MQIKDKIKELRVQHAMTQQQLADELGFPSNANVSHWESGTFEPSMYYLIKLADFFNISLDDVCCRDFKGGK